MANTLGIAERTLAQVADPTNSINVVGLAAGNRKSVYQPHVVRITDHADNVSGETGADTGRMAIFVSSQHGQPWKKDTGLEHRISTTGAPNAKSTIIFPTFNYSTFE